MARPGTKQAPKAVRTIRMDDDVWLKIEERAAIESFTPSEWIRAQCLKGLALPPNRTPAPAPEIPVMPSMPVARPLGPVQVETRFKL